MSLFYQTTIAFLGSFVRFFYRHRVYGTQHIPEGPAIFAPNHASFLDPPLVAVSASSEISFLARASLFDNSLLAWIISRLNAHPVTGTAQDLSSFKLICGLLWEKKKVVIFPEGFRTHTGNLSQLKPGIAMLALRCKCPIVPVYIHGSYSIWNRTTHFPKLWGKTACVFGSPINPEGYLELSKKEAQEAMTEKVKQSLENLQLWYEGGALGCPP